MEKPPPKGDGVSMAGAQGIEPWLTVLETAVLPLYDAPIKKVGIYGALGPER